MTTIGPRGDYDVRPHQFTGKERDAETGLDYFGASIVDLNNGNDGQSQLTILPGRYYSGAQGRFTSPDLPLLDHDTFNPQSWNLYSYVRNNPLINTDPTQPYVDKRV